MPYLPHRSRPQPSNQDPHRTSIRLAWRDTWAIFGEVQAGSRPGRPAIDVVLQKELTYDLSLCTLTNLAMMDNRQATGRDWAKRLHGITQDTPSHEGA